MFTGVSIRHWFFIFIALFTSCLVQGILPTFVICFHWTSLYNLMTILSWNLTEICQFDFVVLVNFKFPFPVHHHSVSLSLPLICVPLNTLICLIISFLCIIASYYLYNITTSFLFMRSILCHWNLSFHFCLYMHIAQICCVIFTFFFMNHSLKHITGFVNIVFFVKKYSFLHLLSRQLLFST